MTPDSFTCEGLQEALAVLEDFTRTATGEVLGGAMRTALRPVRDKARSLAPKSLKDVDPHLEPGLLAKAVSVEIAPRRGAYPSGVAVGMVGIAKGWKRQAGTRGPRSKTPGKVYYQDPVHYAHLAEKGTIRSAAKPFLRPAWDELKDQTSRTLRDAVLAKVQTWINSGKLKGKLRGA